MITWALTPSRLFARDVTLPQSQRLLYPLAAIPIPLRFFSAIIRTQHQQARSNEIRHAIQLCPEHNLTAHVTNWFRTTMPIRYLSRAVIFRGAAFTTTRPGLVRTSLINSAVSCWRLRRPVSQVSHPPLDVGSRVCGESPADTREQ
ncbi:hypothetical protein PISMIDRAFT_239180 [Pisolithus microcarpus 441]|uniref:Uncharacterized protein n=1 Tax=Pisolithus microcarpus 441 TaxID=765257 RepID=A0A0C9ZAG4_9AGAM|nr:hypothetical protein PISMIDRAFT_239180 [Pisolithus microcarpus 441]